jgi:hypothetical protein
MAKFDYVGIIDSTLLNNIGGHEVETQTKTRMMGPKTEEKRYILIREGTSPVILNGQDELIKSFNSKLKSDKDQYYELGPEVEVQVSVSVKSKGAAYRDTNPLVCF